MSGEKNTVTFTVGPERLASHMGSGDLDVLATPAMIAEMERAACTLLARFLEPGQTSVGTAMDVSHMSATPSGMAAEASAEIVAAEGRRVDFTVSARDAAGEIGRGTHSRVIVDAARFQQKTDAKAGAAE